MKHVPRKVDLSFNLTVHHENFWCIVLMLKRPHFTHERVLFSAILVLPLGPSSAGHQLISTIKLVLTALRFGGPWGPVGKVALYVRVCPFPVPFNISIIEANPHARFTHSKQPQHELSIFGDEDLFIEIRNRNKVCQFPALTGSETSACLLGFQPCLLLPKETIAEHPCWEMELCPEWRAVLDS